MFQQDKLHVYQVALSFRADVEEILPSKMTGRASLANQLERAATPVVPNLSEGSAARKSGVKKFARKIR